MPGFIILSSALSHKNIGYSEQCWEGVTGAGSGWDLGGVGPTMGPQSLCLLGLWHEKRLRNTGLESIQQGSVHHFHTLQVSFFGGTCLFDVRNRMLN